MTNTVVMPTRFWMSRIQSASFAQLGVEVESGRRQDRGFDHQRPRNAALLLAAGKPFGRRAHSAPSCTSSSAAVLSAEAACFSPRISNPNATLSATFICGNSA